MEGEASVEECFKFAELMPSLSKGKVTAVEAIRWIENLYG
jgi:hypothetical protein